MQFSYNIHWCFFLEKIAESPDFSREYPGKFPGLHTDLLPMSALSPSPQCPSCHPGVTLAFIFWCEKISCMESQETNMPLFLLYDKYADMGHLGIGIFFCSHERRGQAEEVRRGEKNTFPESIFFKCHLLHRQVCGLKDHRGSLALKHNPEACQPSPVLVP